MFKSTLRGNVVQCPDCGHYELLLDYEIEYGFSVNCSNCGTIIEWEK